MIRYLCCITLLLSMMVPCAGAADEPAPPEDLNALVARALADNPEIKASESRWRMFTHRVAQSRALDDPMLMLKIQNGIVTDPFDFGRDSMTQKVVGISQQLPFWGKRDMKGEVARKEAESYRWSLEERKLELARMVGETYYQLYAVDRAAEIVDRNIRIMDDLIVLSETRYAVGQGVQQDVFKAQVERSKMLDMRITLAQQRASLAATLNMLMNRPAETPVGRIPDFELLPVGPDREALLAIASAERPLLKGYRALVEKGEAAHALADREFYPDFNLSLEYMQRDPAMGGDGADMFSLGVTFNLPVRRERRHAMLAESASETAMAAEELNAARNSIRSGIGDLLAQLDRRKKLAELYRNGIIPQASQALESATISYRVGKVDFLTLLDSRVSLFNYEREYYDSLADYQMKRVQLQALVGGRLPVDAASRASTPAGQPVH